MCKAEQISDSSTQALTEADRSNGLVIKELKVGEINTIYTDVEKRLPLTAVHEARQIIPQWVDLFPREDTWVRRELGVPSLIIRFDATIGEDGRLKPYEIEERPAGIGVGRIINPQFRERFDQVRQTWPEIQVVASPNRRFTDDALWTEVVEKESAKGLVLVRSEPQETDFHDLESRSVSSLKREGDKSYGVGLGLWEKVIDPQKLPWAEPFALKPMQGTKSKDVFIFIPGNLRKQYSTIEALSPGYTQTRIQRDFRPEGMYCQPFHPPIESDLGDPQDRWRWIIWRVYFGYDIQEREWKYLGGVWNGRSNLKIHGAGDSLFGPAN